jgi:hypothetical protein
MCHCWLVQQCFPRWIINPSSHCWTSQQWHTKHHKLTTNHFPQEP